MVNKKIRMTNTGLKITSNWEGICEFSKELEDALEDSRENDESVKGFNGWRPREDEERKDLKKRTAEKATFKKKKIEEGFEGAKKELLKASDNLKRSLKGISNRKNCEESPGKELKNASKRVGKAVGAGSIRSIRIFEEFIFEKIMLKFTPYYFDTENLSINLEKKHERKYVLNINLIDEGAREDIQKRVKRDNGKLIERK
ncbi:MAG: DUF5828 family protein [archaeon]